MFLKEPNNLSIYSQILKFDCCSFSLEVCCTIIYKIDYYATSITESDKRMQIYIYMYVYI